MKPLIKLIVVSALSWGAQNFAYAACIPFDGSNFTITTPGEYCLTKDFDMSSQQDSTAIHIEVDNVTLDLKGHTISNTRVDVATYGITGSGKNIGLKNGSLIGFSTGIDLYNKNSDGELVVDNMLISSSASSEFLAHGIRVYGQRITIKNNVIDKLVGKNVRAIEAWGIDKNYGGTIVIDNNRILSIRSPIEVISGDNNSTAFAQVFGIFVREADDKSLVRNNIVVDLQPGSGGNAVGITYSTPKAPLSGGSISNNQISNPIWIKNSVGIIFVGYQNLGQPTLINGNDINFFNFGIETGIYGSISPVLTNNVVRNNKKIYKAAQQ